jgi:hypothetical protein
MTSFVSLLLPMMIATRLGSHESAASDAFDAIDALRIPRPVNIVFEAVMTIERALIRRGLSFPVGGSLLVVARKRPEVGAVA